jgi:hypothetical protein
MQREYSTLAIVGLLDLTHEISERIGPPALLGSPPNRRYDVNPDRSRSRNGCLWNRQFDPSTYRNLERFEIRIEVRSFHNPDHTPFLKLASYPVPLVGEAIQDIFHELLVFDFQSDPC